MARLFLRVKRDAVPRYCGDDVLRACDLAGLDTEKCDLFDERQATEGFVVDIYNRASLDEFTMQAIGGFLGQMGGLVEVEQMAGWPHRAWHYRVMPVEY